MTSEATPDDQPKVGVTTSQNSNDQAEETTTTMIANDQETTTTTTTTTIGDQETTTTTSAEETTTPNDQPEVGVGLPADGHGAGNDQEENTTTTANNIQTFTSPTTQYQPSADNSLVIGEELVAMDNFKLRSAILLTPDRKSYRNNISIDENEKEYIITIHHGPKLIPGKYQLMIKYRDNQELYKHVIDFI
ncbi:MAG TPA: hypothetical protein P5052_03225 [Candidatus Paceibacterota bacterium]|nr:hypothetical protein [Candidatus Paceibacterota bacterium]